MPGLEPRPAHPSELTARSTATAGPRLTDTMTRRTIARVHIIPSSAGNGELNMGRFLCTFPLSPVPAATVFARGRSKPASRATAPVGRCRRGSDRGEGARRPAVRGRPGHRAGHDLAGRRRPVHLLPAVRLAGLDITIWSSERKGPPGRLYRRGPEVLRWAGMRWARSTPAPRPDHDYYARRQARRAV